MEIGYFKEFVILAETQNYWAAAERLFIGQSSLSKHIKTMEKQLGAPLFERTSRKVELTEFGKLMLPYAQSVARIQYEYESAAFNYVNQENEPLNIGTIPVIAHYNITDILIQFQLNHPTVQVNVQEADTLIVREWLLERKCNLAIFRDSTAYLEHDPDKESQLVKIPYCHDRLMAVLPPDHPLAHEQQLELSQLATEYFALIQQGTMPYMLCMRACREAGFTPQVVFASHSLEAILDMVRKGSCVALLFSNHVSFPHKMTFDDNPPFVTVPIVPEIQTTVCLSYLKNAALTPAAVHFIDYCKMMHFD
ncbi:MAG: LysR family transcriptional regulator [Candidatus Onthomonas sp.]